jgi:hypothetical protein
MKSKTLVIALISLNLLSCVAGTSGYQPNIPASVSKTGITRFEVLTYPPGEFRAVQLQISVDSGKTFRNVGMKKIGMDEWKTKDVFVHEMQPTELLVTPSDMPKEVYFKLILKNSGKEISSSGMVPVR